MGCVLTKNSAVNSPESTSTILPDPASYEAACRLDPELRSFDSSVHHRTTTLLNSLSGSGSFDVQSVSLDSLLEVTKSLLEMDQDVVSVILECKKDIWKNQELFNLVDDYFKNSIETLNFCNALNSCLKRARESQFNLNVAIRQFDEEKREGSKEFPLTLQEFEKLKLGGDPFGDEFFVLFESIYTKQIAMLRRLQVEKGKLDKKLKSMKKWRKLSNVLFVATFTTVLICSVVAVAIAAPPVLAALAAAAALPLGSMGKWVNSIWKKYENEVQEKKGLVGSMEFGSFIVIKDLDNIRVLVEKLEIKMESLLHNADFALGEGEAVELAIDEIKTELGAFMQTIEDLSHYADKCSRDVGMARTLILHKMIKYPSA
ncbi:hypothetical protein DCAR_0208485 [Daucus carota subsp. sativus]|uniref:Uncharacterized protein n=1 Tax=Daucus carota subsp. sativus TaxID=79200 RepID=A0A166EKD0_DAUCS|nr:PREDICTED: UPF0496 protein At4g34320-like [Daucus carota subsp. sativus]WOG89248.1 hypothetical protein DCAR_0208485 [Daucus carota subsp. sativus]